MLNYFAKCSHKYCCTKSCLYTVMILAWFCYKFIQASPCGNVFAIDLNLVLKRWARRAQNNLRYYGQSDFRDLWTLASFSAPRSRLETPYWHFGITPSKATTTPKILTPWPDFVTHKAYLHAHMRALTIQLNWLPHSVQLSLQPQNVPDSWSWQSSRSDWKYQYHVVIQSCSSLDCLITGQPIFQLIFARWPQQMAFNIWVCGMK